MSAFSGKTIRSFNEKPSSTDFKPVDAVPKKAFGQEKLNINHSKLNQSDYVPKRFGLRYDPPTIIMEYLEPSSGKLYHHKMRIQNLKENLKTEDIVNELRKKHSVYFGSDKIADGQIANLIDKLRGKLSQREQITTFEAENVDHINQGSKLLQETNTLDGGKANNKQSSEINSELKYFKNGVSPAMWMNKPEGSKAKEEEDNGFWNLDDDQTFGHQATDLVKSSGEGNKKYGLNGGFFPKQNLKVPSNLEDIHDKRNEFDSKKRLLIG